MSEEVFDVLIDEDFEVKITFEEAKELKSIQKAFILGYLSKKDNVSIDKWLEEEMKKNLPKYSQKEISDMSKEIINTLKVQEEKKVSLEKSIQNGRSKESWLGSELKKATSLMSAQEASEYLINLDKALKKTNEALRCTLYTKTGTVNRNPNLDGFIAEQYHAQTFNLNAEAKGSPYRAKVLEPTASGYAKNSVDIVIDDEMGNHIRRYQAKYCKDAQATAKAFDEGNYRGQRKLVPEGQETDIISKTSTVIEAPDGTTSNPLTKEKAKELQSEAQSGNWNELNWNEYQIKDLAIGIGKQVGNAAIMGAAIGVGFDVAQKVWNGEIIEGEELVDTAIETGTDFGVKVAAAGALKVGVEKGIIKTIPKGTPAETITNIVYVAIENLKILGKVATGEITVDEGIEKIGQTTTSTVSGIVVSTASAATLGSALGTVLGPVGSTIGGLVGGAVGYMAGAKVGETICKGSKKIVEKTIEKAIALRRSIKSTLNKAKDNWKDRVKTFSW